MDVYEAIGSRRSIRSYNGEPVPDDVLARILEAARLAPSARNRQEWRFIAITEAVTRRAMVGACKGQEFVAQAPVLLAFCSTRPHVMSCGVDAGPVDAAIAMSYVTLAATAEGLGTCWLGAFHQDQVRQLLGVPDTAQVIGVMTLGFPAERPARRPRRPRDEVIAFGSWQGRQSRPSLADG
jgi:nitroreductase